MTVETKISERANRAIRNRVFPGCVVGIVNKEGRRDVWPFGRFTYDQNSENVTENTIYDTASVTKSIPTASLALLLIGERKLNLSDKVALYLPELRNHHDATIEDLLRYRVQGTPMSLLKDKSPDKIVSYVFEQGFEKSPGESRYTNLPAFLLGLIVERVGGASLNAQAKERLFEPLEMNKTAFFLNEQPRRLLISPTEIDGGTEICGIPHDESARVFAKEGRSVGHAGVFSTAPDLLNFLEALLIGKYVFTKPIIGGAEKGLGWQVNDPRFMGKYAGERTFGKTGFTGCSVVCDVERGIGFIILSNRTYPRRPRSDDAINVFRRDIADIVFENIPE